jgi:hypothetical protein
VARLLALEVKASDHIGNQLRLRQFQNDDAISRVSASRSSAGAGDSRRRRSTRHTAHQQRGHLPAGILQPPFFGLVQTMINTARSAR